MINFFSKKRKKTLSHRRKPSVSHAEDVKLEPIDSSGFNQPYEKPMERDWFETHQHTPQVMRIINSGLKAEPGAFEHSVFRHEFEAGEWGLTQEAQRLAAERLAELWRRTAEVKATMPKSRKGRLAWKGVVSFEEES